MGTLCAFRIRQGGRMRWRRAPRLVRGAARSLSASRSRAWDALRRVARLAGWNGRAEIGKLLRTFVLIVVAEATNG